MLRTFCWLLLLSGFASLLVSFAPIRKSAYSLNEEPLLRIDSCTFSIGDRSAALGDDVQQWINLLGPYSRCERKRTGQTMFTGSLDSVFIWDSKGITILASEEDDWRVGEAMVFLLNDKSKGVDTSQLHYYAKSANFREIYAETPNYIAQRASAFARGDTAYEREYKQLLTEENQGNLTLPTLYPERTISSHVMLDGSLVKPHWNIKRVNKQRKKNHLPLLAFVMPINSLEVENPMQYLVKKEFETSADYLTTDKTLEGVYFIYHREQKGPVARTTQGRIEFFVIQGIKSCQQE